MQSELHRDGRLVTTRYRFTVNDGSPSLVADLASPMDARREALRIAAEKLFDDSGNLDIPAGWRIDVTDDSGQLLFQIQFTAGGTPRSGLAAWSA